MTGNEGKIWILTDNLDEKQFKSAGMERDRPSTGEVEMRIQGGARDG
jgi:hypothetical protein